MKKKIILAFGTRPEAIKFAPLYALLKNHESFEPVVCVTSQHKELLKQVLDFFNISVDFDLSLMKKDQDLNELNSNIISGFNKILDKVEPYYVLVQGDTNSAMCCALAAFYKKIRIGHIEAGLRTFNKLSPFPKEVNRCLISQIANDHFAPTKVAENNLLTDGINPESIFLTGNTVIDALKMALDKLDIIDPKNLSDSQRLKKDKILITLHRRENFGKSHKNILEGLNSLSENFKDFTFLFPVHPNPNIRSQVKKILKPRENIKIVDPLDYGSFITEMSKAYLVISDSGGIQEEAPSFRIPVLVTRETTERPEGISSGTSILIKDKKSLIESFSQLVREKDDYLKIGNKGNPFGNGDASLKIIENIHE